MGWGWAFVNLVLTPSDICRWPCQGRRYSNSSLNKCLILFLWVFCNFVTFNVHVVFCLGFVLFGWLSAVYVLFPALVQCRDLLHYVSALRTDIKQYNMLVFCACWIRVGMFSSHVLNYFTVKKGHGPGRINFGPVKSLNMTRWKNANSYYICNIWLTTSQNVDWKKIVLHLFMNFQCPQRVAKT